MNRDRGHGAGRDGAGTTGEPGGCATFGPLLEAFYHHALEAEQAQAVAEHAAECALCAATLERFRATDQLIASAPMPAPGPDLRQRLAARIAVACAHRPSGTAASMPITPIMRETVVHDVNHPNDSERTRTGTQAARTGRGIQGIRVWLGTVAAVLVVALLAGAFLTRTHGPTAGTSASTPTPDYSNQTSTATPDHTGYANSSQFSRPAGTCTPARIHANLPASALLFDLAMVSPDEGWAVGAIEGAGNGPVNSLILHYQNCAWTPVATNYPGTTLMSISMVSATEGWAVGGSSDGKQLALRYTGGAWQPVTLPGENSFNGFYKSVHMLSADEGWIVVGYAKDTYGVQRDSLLHLHNGNWSPVDSPFLAISDVLPIAQNDAWVAGSASNGQGKPILYRYQAGSWAAMALPSGVVVDRLRLVSPTDIWASGHVNAPSNVDYEQSAAVLHYNGSGWQQVNTGASGHPQYVQALDQGTAWAFTLDQTMDPDIIRNVYYERSGTWLQVKWPFSDVSMGLAPFGMNPMRRVSPDEYWSLGEAGGSGASVLLYFANGTWHEYGR